MNTRQKGASGEDIAVEHLLSLGYTIVTRNYESRYGELDCVAEDPDGTLVFVEVKSARSPTMGSPLFRVTRAKQRQIILMARQYLADHDLTQRACRFDVIAVTRGQVEHLRNAFLA
jgi:putative endonuclease